MNLTWEVGIGLIWGVFAVYWFLSSRGGRSRADRRESPATRLQYLTLVLISIVLIATDPPLLGPLLWRVWPDVVIAEVIGVAVLLVGLSLAVWARVHLGRHWSAEAVLAEDHELVRTGPYRLVRNPIYLGGLIGLAGTAIAIGELRGVAALALLLVAVMHKIRVEETLLSEHFGAEYDEYRREVKSLIPFVY